VTDKPGPAPDPLDKLLKRVSKAIANPYCEGIWEGLHLNRSPFSTLRTADLTELRDRLERARASEARAAELERALMETLTPFARIGALLIAYEKHKGAPVDLKSFGSACVAAHSALSALTGSNPHG
jgi:hypothetical protein